MLSLLTLLTTAHAYSLFTDPDFLKSNCRFRSSVNQFASAINSYDQHKRWIGLKKDYCEDEQRLAILANITDPTGVTLTDDSGVVEFREPGTDGAMTECTYAVRKGRRVPRAVLEMNGTIKHEGGFWPEDVLKIRSAVRKLVTITCEALTS